MDKLALITGASRGIGKALAESFAKNGYSLILTARGMNELTVLQAELKSKYQCEAKIYSVDLASPTGADDLVQACGDDLSKIDVLVNNAGFGAAKKFNDMSADEMNGMIEVNIGAVTRLTYSIIPHMLARKSGRILNLASTAAYAPGPYMAMYYASKAYVLSLSQALHEEFAKDGISISTLCPGPTMTGFSVRAGTDKSLLTSKMIMPQMTAEAVADAAYRGLMNGKRVIIPGIMNKISVILMWLAPTFLALKVIPYLNKPKASNEV